ncbi:MAG: dihydropteroate synthase [Rhodospirillales bacterium]
MTTTFAGLSLAEPLFMGVVNATPDSFSDGGDAFSEKDAVARGLALMEAGAAIIDVGGESTRPGAEVVSPNEEIRRTEPVIRSLSEAGAVVSIDTRNAETMRRAIAAGATIVNDVTALTHDPLALETVAESGACVMLMHMQGEPQTMQANPIYDDVVTDVLRYLQDRATACAAAGIAVSKIAIDPGIGFGKTVAHNLRLLRHLDLFVRTGYPVVLGVSRKSFIAKLSQGEEPKERISGSVAAAIAGLQAGVQIYRVHDVAETRQAFAIWRAIAAAH